jgi:hypothetical protein
MYLKGAVYGSIRSNSNFELGTFENWKLETGNWKLENYLILS